VKISHLDDMVGGWFMGDFSPAVLRTSAVEIACKHYKAGDVDQCHIHKIATELTLLVSGRVTLNGVEIHPGQIVTTSPGEPAEFRVLQDAITVVVKTPGVVGDKYPSAPSNSTPVPQIASASE
jgi:hypothetical protein